MLKNKDFSLQFIRVLYLCGGHIGMTLTDWEEGRKAYLLSVLSPAQGQLNAANCMLWFHQFIHGFMVKLHIEGS